MTSRSADQVLEQWLANKINGLIKTNPYDDQSEGQRRFYYTEGYSDALTDALAQLHTLWQETKNEDHKSKEPAEIDC